MPKEVFGRQQRSSDEPYQFRAVLKWGADQTCQLGVETDGWFSFHSGTNEEFEYNSLWFTFETRDEFNRMIRSLRKMRDLQFGRDE